jgi:hypothetical protein
MKASGVLYPILTRMLNEGWPTNGWEDGVVNDSAPSRIGTGSGSVSAARRG